MCKSGLGRPWTPDDHRKLVAMREAGSTWAEVGAAFGISKERARQRYEHAVIRGYVDPAELKRGPRGKR